MTAERYPSEPPLLLNKTTIHRVRAMYIKDEADIILLQKLDTTFLSENERLRAMGVVAVAAEVLHSTPEKDVEKHDSSEASENVTPLQISHELIPTEILGKIFAHILMDDIVRLPQDASMFPWAILRGWHRARLSRLVDFLNETSLPVRSLTVLHTTDLLSAEVVRVVIAPQVPRLQELHLDLHISALITLLDAPPEDFSSLESLDLRISGFPHRVTVGEGALADSEALDQWSHLDVCRGTKLFTKAASLKEVIHATTGDRSFSMGLLSLPLPWNQLRSLTLDRMEDISPVDIHPVLQKCRSLEKFSASFDRHDAVVVAGGDQETTEVPCLNFVALDRRLPTWLVLSSLQIPWNRITTLHLQDASHLTLFDLFRILSHCRGIKELAANIHGRGIPPHPPIAVLALPHLSRLSLIIPDSLIFQHLTLPSLTSLTIDVPRDTSLPALDIALMLKRSKCALSTFTYHGTGSGDHTALDTLLSLMPFLTQLRCARLIIGPATMQSISCGLLLPSLRVLTCQLREPCVAALVEMLELCVEGRARGEGGVLSRAWGFYEARAGAFSLGTEVLVGRVRALNREFETDFRVIKRLRWPSWLYWYCWRQLTGEHRRDTV
ncbi:hypothetical protein FPV67DRAFT_1787067 [Lyophyllum atratum]|nr:hypothetical protein FPV67DRAFT_1787067 [Lyophyllum atratum]